MLPALLVIPPAAAERPPVCETVLVQEASSAGPNYHILLCGTRELDVSTITVDGERFPERSTHARVVVFWASSGDAGDP